MNTSNASCKAWRQRQTSSRARITRLATLSNELRDGEQLEVYYVSQADEPILVSKIAYLEPHVLTVP